MKNLLADIPESAVKSDPFPHILIENAYPVEECEALLREFPETNVLTKGVDLGSNKRADYVVKDIRDLGGVSDKWREFIEANASPEFLADFFRLFKKHIKERYPDFEERFGGFATGRAGVRNIDSYREKDFLLDAHISLNTPVSGQATSVRTAHVDDPRKLYGGLWYLRREDDDSTGGEFVLYRYKSGARPMFVGQQIADQYVEEVTRVPYAKNTLVLFLNTFDSVHGVTPRLPTEHPRIFVNLVAECEKPFYDIVSYQESGLPKLVRRGKNFLKRLMA